MSLRRESGRLFPLIGSTRPDHSDRYHCVVVQLQLSCPRSRTELAFGRCSLQRGFVETSLPALFPLVPSLNEDPNPVYARTCFFFSLGHGLRGSRIEQLKWHSKRRSWRQGRGTIVSRHQWRSCVTSPGVTGGARTVQCTAEGQMLMHFFSTNNTLMAEPRYKAVGVRRRLAIPALGGQTDHYSLSLPASHILPLRATHLSEKCFPRP